jgi:hypothetical protein
MAPVQPVLHRLFYSKETVRNARKDELGPTQLRLANLRVNGTCSVCFATSFMQ